MSSTARQNVPHIRHVITFTNAQLSTWVAGLMWPLTRVLGVIALAPVLGHSSIPRRQKIAFGLIVTLILAPLLPPPPAIDPFSLNGVLILANQLLIGVAMGLAMRIVFAAIELAGELVALTMGLNFATFFDPQNHGASSVVSQFLLAIGTLTFLTLDGHLLLLSALAESFRTLPLGASSLGSQGILGIAEWGSTVFSAAIQLSLPMVAALLVASASLGILTRAAPQLNIFGVGFPISIGFGLLVMGLALPHSTIPLGRLFEQGLQFVHDVIASR